MTRERAKPSLLHLFSASLLELCSFGMIVVTLDFAACRGSNACQTRMLCSKPLKRFYGASRQGEFHDAVCHLVSA